MSSLSRFISAANEVISDAVATAARMRHPFVGSEHLLLALSRDGGIAGESLATLGVTPELLQEQVEAAIQPMADGPDQPPFTRLAKQVLEASLREALQLDRERVGTEHVLLGIAACKGNGALRLLLEQQLKPNDVRRVVIDRLTRDPEGLLRGKMRGPPTAAGGELVERPPPEEMELGVEPTAGMQVGDYRLVEAPIATPAWAGKPWVWRARYEPSGEEQVLKMYLLEQLDEDQRQRLEVEAEMGRRWSRYREVVPTIFAEEIGAYFVIAMRPMGRTIEEHIEYRRRIASEWRSDETYAAWIYSIAAVLQLIHDEGDLHRDITSRNLMLEHDGEHVRLSDFSISVDRAADRVTATGEFVGTRGEVAPEHYRGEHTPAGDQYQLALVSWQMFADAPYPGDPETRLHPAVRAVLERALSARPKERHSNVLTFATLLKAAVEAPGRPLIGLLVHGPPAMRRLVTRIPLALLLLATLIAWSGREAYSLGTTGDALVPAILGFAVLVGAMVFEFFYNSTRGRGASSEGTAPVSDAINWTLPIAGAAAGIGVSELVQPGVIPDFLRWLVPWLAAAAVVLVQGIAGRSPRADEGDQVVGLLKLLDGSRGVVPAGLGFAGTTVAVVGGGALVIAFIRG